MAKCRQRGLLGGILGLFLVLAATTEAAAQEPAPAGSGDFGLGLILGNPTGLSMRYYYGVGSNSIDLALGATFLGKEGLHLHADHLWILAVLAREQNFDLHLYGGVGGRILSHDRRDRDDHIHLGGRAPVGVSFDFTRAGIPLEAFAEGAILLDWVSSDDDDENSIELDANLAIGARYYF